MDIIKRKNAKAQGLSYYFTGKPCKHGHISKRLVDSGVCYECSLLHKQTTKSKDSYRKYRENNKELVNARTLKYYHAVLAPKIKELRVLDPIEGYKNQRMWERRHPGKKRAITAKRRAQLLQAIPPWFESEKKQIDDLYTQSKLLTQQTGVLYTVDHIVPLLGETVCGLHCLANLRIILGSDNFSKNNKLIESLVCS